LPLPSARSSLGLSCFLPTVSLSSVLARGIGRFRESTLEPAVDRSSPSRARSRLSLSRISISRPFPVHHGFPWCTRRGEWEFETFLGVIATIETLRDDLWCEASVRLIPLSWSPSARARSSGYSDCILLVALGSRTAATAFAANFGLRIRSLRGLRPYPSLMGSGPMAPRACRFIISLHPPHHELCWSLPESKLSFRSRRLSPPKRFRQPLCGSTRSWFRSLQRAVLRRAI